MAYTPGYAPTGYNPGFMRNPYGDQPMQPAPQQPMGYYPQAQPMAQQPNVMARMVTGRAEAEAAQIAFDSTINIFADMAHGLIYIKRFNPMTGGADMQVYAAMQQQDQPREAEPKGQAFATLDQMTSLSKRLDELEARLTDTPEARTARAKKEDAK